MLLTPWPGGGIYCAAEAEASSVGRESGDQNEQSEVARRPEAEREMAGAEGQATDMLKAGASYPEMFKKIKLRLVQQYKAVL